MKELKFAKLFQPVFYVLMLCVTLGLVCACGDEEDDPIQEPDTEQDSTTPGGGDDGGSGSTPSAPVKNTTDRAVSDSVVECGCTYASISGYANLNLLPEGYENASIKIELRLAGDDTGNALYGSTNRVGSDSVVVRFTNLSPATKYEYRTYVSYGAYMNGNYLTFRDNGAWLTFTTRSVPNVTVTGAATGVTLTLATFTASVNTEALDLKEDLRFGFAYSTSKGALHPDSLYYVKKQYSQNIVDGSYTTSLSGLLPGTTYYYASFAEVGGKYSVAEVKSFATRSIPNVTTTGEATGVTYRSATVSAGLKLDEVDLRDNLRFGVAWSASKADLRNDNLANVQTGYSQSVVDGVYTVNLSGLSSETTYYYAAFAEVNGKYCMADVKEFTTEDRQSALNGHEAVDLGLSVMWATCNVGASSPEEYGDYFAWGETTTKSSYYESNSTTYYLSTSELQSRGIIGSDGNLTAAYDAATANWGGSWRMPTLDEMKELLNNCTWTWTTQNGVRGRKVTGSNGNSIFLPAAGSRYGTYLYYAGSYGYYWSATPCSSSYYAYGLYFNSDDYDWHYGDRYFGHSVRPVSE